MITVRHFLKPVAKKVLLNPTVKQLRFQTTLLSDRTRRTIPFPYKARLVSPVFIVGSSRSGTSMLTRILGSSSELQYFAENLIVRRHMWQMVKDPSSIADELPELEKTLIRLSGVSEGQRLLEKTPGHSLLVNELANYFPNAQFIHPIRDGRDVALSMLGHSSIRLELEENNHEKIFWFDLIPEHLQNKWQTLSLWRRAVIRWAIFLNSAKQIAFDRERYHETSYEDLCLYSEATLGKVISFLNLKDTETIKSQLSDIKTNSINRWQQANLSEDDLNFYSKIQTEFNVNCHDRML